MSAQIIDGHEVARALRAQLRADVAAYNARTQTQPRLFALGSSADPAAERYLALKAQAAHDAGIAIDTAVLPPSAGTDDALALLDTAALDAAVHAIFVQYPLPGIDMHACCETIPSLKDVDGASAASRERLRRGLPAFVPATVAAILAVLEHAGVALAGVDAVIAPGDPKIAEPLALLLERAGARVTESADFGDAVVVVFPDGINPWTPATALPHGAFVIDAGYTASGAGTVVLEEAAPHLRAFVPARGGIGPVVVEMLMRNTLRAAEAQAL